MLESYANGRTAKDGEVGMTDREKAIVMAYTGYTMLTGDKLGLYYQYIQGKVGRPVMTHELAEKPMQETIQTLSKPDFVELCRTNDEPRVMTLEEIQELHVYWVEDYGGSLIPETIMCIEPNFSDLEGSSKEIITIPVVRMGNGYAPVITKINHYYNIKWRCWTSQPTDEQREATPWRQK